MANAGPNTNGSQFFLCTAVCTLQPLLLVIQLFFLKKSIPMRQYLISFHRCVPFSGHRVAEWQACRVRTSYWWLWCAWKSRGSRLKFRGNVEEGGNWRLRRAEINGACALCCIHCISLTFGFLSIASNLHLVFTMTASRSFGLTNLTNLIRGETCQGYIFRPGNIPEYHIP